MDKKFPSLSELRVGVANTLSPFRAKIYGSTPNLNKVTDSPRGKSPKTRLSSPFLLRKVSADRDKHHVRPGAPSEPNEYNFNYKRRGVFLIINNKHFLESTGQIDREGTDIDAERLEERFQDTGFEVRRYDDVTCARMIQLIHDIATSDHSDSDCFGCAVLSHGKEGYIYATDKLVPLENLVLPFKGNSCPTLIGKPKLFFIQACTDRRTEKGEHRRASPVRHGLNDLHSSHLSSRRVPVEADFLFSYSTVPGYYSWRNNQEGSWYIQALCIVLENYGGKMELMQMLTQVNRMVAYEFEACSDEEFTEDLKQMPSIVSMLTRYVYFRPKKPDIRG